MSKYINDDAIGEDPSKAAEDDKRLAVRFTNEQRLNHAAIARRNELNAAIEDRAVLLEAAHKFDEADALRKTKYADDPIYRTIEFISINIPGDKTLAIHRPVMASDKVRFRAKYEAFKNQQGDAIEGTPIDQLPELRAAQVAELNYVGVTTIEQLAKVADGSPLMSMMGGQTLKQRAAAWVAKNRRSSVVTQTNEALKERDDRIAKLEEQLQALIASAEASRGNEPQKAARK